jgi:hypothetical protein
MASVPEKDKFSVCGHTLAMPAMITAQNGVVVEQSTKIARRSAARAKNGVNHVSAIGPCDQPASPVCRSQAQ